MLRQPSPETTLVVPTRTIARAVELTWGAGLAIVRCTLFAFWAIVCSLAMRLTAFVMWASSVPPAQQLKVGAAFAHVFLRFACVLFGIQVKVRGKLPDAGSLVVSNHRSYLDIAALGAVVPSLFLAKASVAKWPMVGSGGRAAGLIYVRRRDLQDRRIAAHHVRDVVESGCSVVVFPEGTTSSEDQPLAFRSGIFRTVAGRPVTISPVTIRYADGASDWVGDDTFARHIFAQAARWRTGVELVFSRPLSAADFDEGTELRDFCHQRVAVARPHGGDDDLTWLKKPILRVGHFRCADRNGAKLTVRVFDQPGRWMSGLALRRLHEDLLRVAGNALDEVPTYGLFTGARSAFANRVIAVAYDDAIEAPIAFTAMVYLPFVSHGKTVPIMHLGLTMIDADHRGRRLQTPLFKRVFLLPLANQRRIDFIVTNIAASPAGIGSVSDYFQDTFPHYAGTTRRSSFHLEVAQQVLARFRHEFGCSRDAEFDPDTFVVHGSNDPKGGGAHQFIKHDPVSRYRVEACNFFCRQVLDFDNGDELFQVGRAHLLKGLWAARKKRRRLAAA